MLTTCGSSSRWVRRSNRPNGVIRGSSLAGPLVARVPSGRRRMVRNFRMSNVAPFLPDPRLAVEERAPVRDQVADDDERA